jgi:hypothetical protein
MLLLFLPVERTDNVSREQSAGPWTQGSTIYDKVGVTCMADRMETSCLCTFYNF